MIYLKLICLTIILAILLSFTCKKDQPSNSEKYNQLNSPICSPIIVNDSLYTEYININLKDNQYYDIVEGSWDNGSITINHNCITIPVYTGGYDKFELVWNGLFTKTYPPETGLVLYHENTSITKDGRPQNLKFDLSLLISRLNQLKPNKIILNLKAYGKSDFNKKIILKLSSSDVLFIAK